MAERHAGEAALAVGDRIEHRRSRAFGLDRLALGRQDRLDRGGDAAGERDLDEDQRFIGQGGMEEGVAAPIRRIDPRAQVIPVADRMHRLVADDLLEQVRRGRPVDALEHQEATIEPGREQVEEVVVDDGEIVAMIHRVHQLLAHAHQRRGAAGGEIEAAEKFEPSRLGCAMHLGGSCVRGRGEPGAGRRAEPVAVHAEAARQRLEEGDARPGRQFRVAREDFARERHAGGFAAAGQQVFTELRQAFRALLGDAAPITRAIDERAAALGDRLQHVAEGGGAHGG